MTSRTVKKNFYATRTVKARDERSALTLSAAFLSQEPILNKSRTPSFGPLREDCRYESPSEQYSALIDVRKTSPSPPRYFAHTNAELTTPCFRYSVLPVRTTLQV